MNQLFINAAVLVGQGISYSKLYLYHLAAVWTFPQFLKSLFKLQKKDFVVILPLGILVLYPWISILWSDSRSAGAVDAIQISCGAYIVFYNHFVKTERKVLDRSIICILLVNLGISLIEAFQLYRFPFSSLVGKTVSDVPTGFHWNQNNNGFFILLFTPLILKHFQSYKRYLFLIVSSFLIVKIGSKLILVSWFVMLLIILTNEFKIRREFLRKLFIIFLAAAAGLILFFYSQQGSYQFYRYSKILPVIKAGASIVPDMIMKRIRREPVTVDASQIDSSLNERLTMLDGVLVQIADSPFFGNGAGSLADKVHAQGGIVWGLKTPHLYWLECLAKFGIFYLLLYFFWLFRLIRSNWNKHPEVVISLIAFILFNPVISSAIYFLPKWALFSYALVSSRENPKTP